MLSPSNSQYFSSDVSEENTFNFITNLIKEKKLHFSKDLHNDITAIMPLSSYLTPEDSGQLLKAGFAISFARKEVKKIFTPNDTLYLYIQGLLAQENITCSLRNDSENDKGKNVFPAIQPSISNSIFRSYLPQEEQPGTSGINNNPTITLNKSMPYTCEICKKGFYAERGVNIHRAIAHPKLSKVLKKCNYCDKTSNSTYRLEIHERSHTGEKPFKCQKEGCDKTFRDPANLTKHIIDKHK